MGAGNITQLQIVMDGEGQRSERTTEDVDYIHYAPPQHRSQLI